MPYHSFIALLILSTTASVSCFPGIDNLRARQTFDPGFYGTLSTARNNSTLANPYTNNTATALPTLSNDNITAAAQVTTSSTVISPEQISAKCHNGVCSIFDGTTLETVVTVSVNIGTAASATNAIQNFPATATQNGSSTFESTGTSAFATNTGTDELTTVRLTLTTTTSETIPAATEALTWSAWSFSAAVTGMPSDIQPNATSRGLYTNTTDGTLSTSSLSSGLSSHTTNMSHAWVPWNLPSASSSVSAVNASVTSISPYINSTTTTCTNISMHSSSLTISYYTTEVFTFQHTTISIPFPATLGWNMTRTRIPPSHLPVGTANSTSNTTQSSSPISMPTRSVSLDATQTPSVVSNTSTSTTIALTSTGTPPFTNTTSFSNTSGTPPSNTTLATTTTSLPTITQGNNFPASTTYTWCYTTLGTGTITTQSVLATPVELVCWYLDCARPSCTDYMRTFTISAVPATSLASNTNNTTTNPITSAATGLGTAASSISDGTLTTIDLAQASSSPTRQALTRTVVVTSFIDGGLSESPTTSSTTFRGSARMDRAGYGW